MATVASLAEELAIEAGEDYDDTDVANQFHDWVREGYELIVASARFLWQNKKWDVNTVASTAEYTLDSTVAEVLAIQDTTSTARVSYMPVERLIALDLDLASEDAPTNWYYTGMNTSTTAIKFSLYPVPDGVYALDIHTLVRPTALGDNDTIPVPDEFILLIRQFVRGMVLFNMDQTELYTQAMNRFDAMLQLYVTRYNQPRRSQSRLKVKNLPGVRQAPAAAQD